MKQQNNIEKQWKNKLYKQLYNHLKINKMDGYPDPNSVVDTLKSNGYPSDYETRKDLYERAYGGNYTGSAEQNTRMNKDLKNIFD